MGPSVCPGGAVNPTRGYTAKEACIALDETTGQLTVMLQAKDAANVNYRDLSTSDKKVFDAYSRHSGPIHCCNCVKTFVVKAKVVYALLVHEVCEIANQNHFSVD